MSNRITRRQFAGTVATGALLATWQTARAQSGFLQWMERWNERVERFMFGADRLAAELPPSETTPAEAFPSYFISDTVPVVPAGWVLKVGGLVARPTAFSLAQWLIRGRCTWNSVRSMPGTGPPGIGRVPCTRKPSSPTA